MTRKRRVAGLVTGLTLAATIALAFIAGTALLEGSGSAKVKKGGGEAHTYSLSITMGAGELSPGGTTLGKDAVSGHEIMINNTGPRVITIPAGTKVQTTVTTSSTECLPAWFEVKPTGPKATELLEGTEPAFTIAKGSSELFVDAGGSNSEQFALYEHEEGVPQNACEGATVTETIKLVGLQ